MTELDAEDAKLVTLARGARGRVQASSGAALRDETGRTYAAAEVTLPSLALSAVALVVAQAVASGSRGAEAVVVVGEGPSDLDIAILRELAGPGAPVLVCDPSGTVRERLQS